VGAGRRIEGRAAVPAGGTDGRVRGYPTPAERHAKTVRLKALRGRLSKVERRLDGGAVSNVLGGKNLLRKRQNLTAAGLTEDQWRQQWEAARLFLTADGEAGKPWGNETIRFHPGEGWVEIKLPAPLANRPHGRYRLSCPVAFSYRGDEVAAQAATGASPRPAPRAASGAGAGPPAGSGAGRSAALFLASRPGSCSSGWCR
jgi:hypothetical protein